MVQVLALPFVAVARFDFGFVEEVVFNLAEVFLAFALAGVLDLALGLVFVFGLALDFAAVLGLVLGLGLGLGASCREGAGCLVGS